MKFLYRIYCLTEYEHKHLWREDNEEVPQTCPDGGEAHAINPELTVIVERSE